MSQRYARPFEVLERIGNDAYRVALPPKLANLHDVFFVSMLKKYHPDSTHVIDFETIEVDEKLKYIEEPVKILDRKEQVL